MPQVPTARVRWRVVLTALNAKLVLRALSERMNRYEEQYGEVVVRRAPDWQTSSSGTTSGIPQMGEAADGAA